MRTTGKEIIWNVGICFLLAIMPLSDWLERCEAESQTPTGRAIQPAPELPGGYKLHTTNNYNMENLYEMIDGEAVRFIDFGFKNLLVVQYKSQEEGLADLEVEIYDMAARRNAYGIYVDSQPPEIQDIQVGNRGYIYRTVATFWKGEFYVHVRSYADEPIESDILRAARVVATWIDDESKELEEFSAFIGSGLDRESIAYKKRSAFGFPYEETFSANYEIGESRWKVFFSYMGTDEKARQIFRDHVNFIADNGEIRYQAADLVWGTEKYNHDTLLIVKDSVVAGCMGLGDRETAETQVRQLISRAIQHASPLGKKDQHLVAD